MATEIQVRWGWLKFMYVLTVLIAGPFGLGIVFAPDFVRSVCRMPSQDPVVFGITGSVYLAFALLSLLGLRSPLQVSPVLLLQLAYKVIWLFAVVVPLSLRGEFPTWAILYLVIFIVFVIGDIVAIPFRYVFGVGIGNEAAEESTEAP
jgi:hypothetical protein